MGLEGMGGREHGWETGGWGTGEGGLERHKPRGWTKQQELSISQGRPCGGPQLLARPLIGTSRLAQSSV